MTSPKQPRPQWLVIDSPRDCYAGMAAAWRNGDPKNALVLARVLIRELRKNARILPRDRVPIVLEVERAASERLGIRSSLEPAPAHEPEPALEHEQEPTMPKISEEFASKYLKAADIADEDAVLTIDGATIEVFEDDKDGRKVEQKKIVVSFRETEKLLVCNATNRNTIVALYGDDTDDWEGKRVTLYSTLVQFGNKQVEAIRVKSKPPRSRAAEPAAIPAAKKAPEPIDGGEGDADIPF